MAQENSSSDTKKYINHEEGNFLSVFTLSNFDALFKLGSQRQLELSDLGLLTESERVAAVSAIFKAAWEKELQLPKDKASLWRAIRATTGVWKMVWSLLMYAISVAAQFGPPMILRSLSLHFASIQCRKYEVECGTHLSDGVLWFIVAMLFVCPVVGTMFSARSYSVFSHIGCVIRSAILPAVYEKSLVLSSRSKHEFSTGRVVNLFSNDLLHVQTFFQNFAEPFFAPAQLAVGLALIYQEVGVSMFTGFGVIGGTLPLMLITFGLYGTWRGEKMKCGDSRIKLTNEIMSGIRIIKFYAWERPFVTQIKEIREKELSLLGKMNYIIVIIICLIYIIPVIIPILIFYTFAKLGHVLTPTIAFTVLSLITLVTQPVNQIPQLLQRWMLTQNSMERIKEFLLCEELKPYVITNRTGMEDEDPSVVIRFKNASFSWLTEQDVEEERLRVEKEANEAAAKKTAEEEKLTKKNKSGEGAYSSVPSNENEVATAEAGLELVTVGDGAAGAAGTEPLSPGKGGPNRSIHTLVNLNLKIKSGQLVAVIGPVGSGKSSFLSALLGELIIRSAEEVSQSSEKPSLHVVGKVAYHAQTPWILNASVKDNIVFGTEYNEERFQRAIAAACLEADIAILPSGLDTEIGEKGINLSGGQKARVSFARTVYQNSDILLLDDPLSAVDAHVGQHLFQNGIRGALAGKTVVLVTHQVHLLEDCDMVIVLDGGLVRGAGNMREIRAMGIDVHALMSSSSAGGKRDRSNSETRGRSRTGSDVQAGTRDRARTGSSINENSVVGVPKRAVSDSSAGSVDDSGVASASAVELAETEGSASDDEIEGEDATEKVVSEVEKQKLKNAELITKEERVDGAVPTEVYVWYASIGGWTPLMLTMIVSLAAQVAVSYSSFWLAEWGKKSGTRDFLGEPFSTKDNIYYLNIFAMLSLCSLLGAGLRGALTVYHGLRATRFMHHTMLERVVSAPVAFFDTTPLGRIINRFSSDITLIDDGCGFQLGWILGMVFTVMGIVGNIAYSTNGTFLALCVPLCFIYYFVQLYFRKTNVELKRLESTSKSPIYTEFSQALAGAVSLRAFGAQQRFIKRMQDYVDRNSTAWILQWMCVWWLNLRLDFLGGLVSLFCAVLAISAPGFVPDNYLALALQNAFAVTSTLKWLVLIGAQFEALMNNVERLHHYCHFVDNEEVYTSKDNQLVDEHGSVISLSGDEADGQHNVSSAGEAERRARLLEQVVSAKRDPPSSWPAQGIVSGREVEMSYRSGPLVLKGIDFDIASMQKIGVAGRTGCGKSSLMIALFRMERLSKGTISIDGVDIETIPLEKLRSKLGIIPQDPVLFSSSVRFNLDPFSLHSDAEIWQALEGVNMKDAIESLPSKLLEVVAEGGENFSTGERQLLCIARALLRKPKVLVLDEATASVDNETDALIQRTIRSQFQHCTILTIAHRLHTIIDSDRIIVMDKGLIAEMDEPQALINKDNGQFASLWKQHQQSRKHKKDKSATK